VAAGPDEAPDPTEASNLSKSTVLKNLAKKSG